MERIDNPMFTSKYTYVEGGNISELNATAFHDFVVKRSDDGEILQNIHFQQGPIKECGVNGVCDEDLLLMVITRLEQFNMGDFLCIENAYAVSHLKEHVVWLRERTRQREARGVEGTHQV